MLMQLFASDNRLFGHKMIFTSQLARMRNLLTCNSQGYGCDLGVKARGGRRMSECQTAGLKPGKFGNSGFPHLSKQAAAPRAARVRPQ